MKLCLDACAASPCSEQAVSRRFRADQLLASFSTSRPMPSPQPVFLLKPHRQGQTSEIRDESPAESPETSTRAVSPDPGRLARSGNPIQRPEGHPRMTMNQDPNCCP